jgi:hypothetical protein
LSGAATVMDQRLATVIFIIAMVLKIGVLKIIKKWQVEVDGRLQFAYNA